MRRFVLGLVSLVVVAVLAGCGAIAERVDVSAYEKIHRQLLAMENFVAQATVTYISNNNSHTYETTQHARTTGEYRIEVTSPLNVAGNTTIFDGSVISQFNPKIDGQISQTVTETPERLEILLTSFVRNFIRSEEVGVTAASMDESLTTVLEATIPGEHPYISTAKLWVCNDSLKPRQMVIFDANGAQRVVVVYNTFEYNADIADELFKIN